jgi:hypothetical protein
MESTVVSKCTVLSGKFLCTYCADIVFESHLNIQDAALYYNNMIEEFKVG